MTQEQAQEHFRAVVQEYQQTIVNISERCSNLAGLLAAARVRIAELEKDKATKLESVK